MGAVFTGGVLGCKRRCADTGYFETFNRANVPVKPRVFMPCIGFPMYSEKLREVAGNDYEGFVKAG